MADTQFPRAYEIGKHARSRVPKIGAQLAAQGRDILSSCSGETGMILAQRVPARIKFPDFPLPRIRHELRYARRATIQANRATPCQP